MTDFKFTLGMLVETPEGKGRICDRFDTEPIVYRVVMVQKYPVIILTFEESRLDSVETI